MPAFPRRCPKPFKGLAGGMALWIAATALAGADPVAEGESKAGAPPEEPVPLNVVAADASYVFSSGFDHKGIGDGDAIHRTFDFTRRFPLTGNWFLQAGVSQDRFDFGGPDRGPLPSDLEAVDIPLGISYITQGHIGFIAQFRPGFYFEHEISPGAFDVPFELGGYLPLINEKLYACWGMRAALLQHYIVFPTAGLIWVINPTLILHAHLPEPRLEYNATERLMLWVGGEVVGGTYKMDSGENERFSGTAVQYYEIRSGVGAVFTPAKGLSIQMAVGYSCQRKFDFYRADQSYTADPAPYVRLQASAEF